MSGSHISLIAVIAWIAVILRLPLSATAVLSGIFFYVLLAGMVPLPYARYHGQGLPSSGWCSGLSATRNVTPFDQSLPMLMVSRCSLSSVLAVFFWRRRGFSFSPCTRLEDHRLPRLVFLLSITIAAQLVKCFPYWHGISIGCRSRTLFLNLIVVPIVELIIIMGLFAGIVTYLLPL